MRSVSLKRVLASCSFAMLLLAAACAPVTGSESTETDSGTTPEIPFSGTLVFLDGDTVTTLDGQSGQRADLFQVEGELGWSGFASVTTDGTVFYESLAEGRAVLRSRESAQEKDSVIAEGVSAIHDFDGRHLLFSDESDTKVWDTESGKVFALGTGNAFDALLAYPGMELGYAAPSDEDVDDSAGGEPEQIVAVRRIEKSGEGTELVRGWHAFGLHLLDDELLAYTALPFGGTERGDLLLFDRRSSVATTIAPDVRVLDTDPRRRLVAVETTASDASRETATQLAICDLSEPATPTVAPVGEPVSGHATQVHLVGGGDGLLAAVRQEGGGSTLVLFGRTDGSQRTVFDTAEETITQLVLHPSAGLAFYTLQAQGTPAEPGTRTLWVCDIGTGDSAPLAETSSGGLLQIVGVVP